MIVKQHRHSGFTLVELLVAMVIAGIVLTGIYTAYRSQLRSYVTQEKVVDMQQNIRNALYYLKRSLQMAGYDPQSSGTMGFVGNFGAPYDTIGATTDANNLAFTVDADEDGAIDPSDQEMIAYRLNGGRLQKLRIDPGSGAASWVTVAENVDALDFAFLDNANPPNVLAAPLDLTAVRSVQVTIVARSNDDPLARNRIDNNIYQNQQGDQIFGPAGDKVRRKHLTAQVRCRNLGL
jgi:type IV pilus assembly protein PilW